MIFTGGPTVATGVWPAGSQLTGTAVATQSNVTNGNNATLPIGLVPISVGPALSPAYNATLLTPNVGNLVTGLGAPYNDTGDKYHVDIDFLGTSSGFLPAGSTFAILDLDITENFRKVAATDPSNNPITTPWIAGPVAYFDMNNPVFVPGSNPTLNGPVSGVYDMLGVNFNFDVGFWQFSTTQNIRTISFDMEVGVGGNTIGGGGGGWAFYTANVPEPTTVALVSIGLAASSGALRRRSRR